MNAAVSPALYNIMHFKDPSRQYYLLTETLVEATASKEEHMVSNSSVSLAHHRARQFVISDQRDGSIYEDHRNITDLDWINRQGWQVFTCLIGSESDSTKNQGYMINRSLLPLIKAGHNPKRFMEMV